MKPSRLAAIGLLATSAAACGDCNKSNVATTDASTAPPVADAAPAPTKPPPPDPGIAPETLCRTLARDITARACACPQAGGKGCCFMGQGKGAPAYVSCSSGATDWPSKIEKAVCADPKKDLDAIRTCKNAKDAFVCATSTKGDRGLQLPPACEGLMKKAAP